jgi:hypothetical protein
VGGKTTTGFVEDYVICIAAEAGTVIDLRELKGMVDLEMQTGNLDLADSLKAAVGSMLADEPMKQKIVGRMTAALKVGHSPSVMS